jgi:hypothetical protein
MKLDLTEKVLDLEGNELFSGQTAGRVLAQYLMEISTKEPIRVFKIAMQLLDEKPFEVDQKDCDVLTAIVEGGNLSNIFKARILTKVEECKDGN